MREIVVQIEHQYLNEISPFCIINLTAENIAAWLYNQFAPQIIENRCIAYCHYIMENRQV